jgi:hypothetical protein
MAIRVLTDGSPSKRWVPIRPGSMQRDWPPGSHSVLRSNPPQRHSHHQRSSLGLALLMFIQATALTAINPTSVQATTAGIEGSLLLRIYAQNSTRSTHPNSQPWHPSYELPHDLPDHSLQQWTQFSVTAPVSDATSISQTKYSPFGYIITRSSSIFSIRSTPVISQSASSRPSQR